VEQARPVAVITGGSSGIGLELAKLFARDGFDLVLVARTPTTLEQAAAELRRGSSGSVTTICADLATAGAVDQIIAELTSSGARVEALVNNAGFGAEGPFAIMPPDDVLGMLQVNVVALTLLTQRILPDMVRRGSGKILNVASTAAFQPGPRMAVYYASKSYVLSFSEALSEELRGTGVVVSALCPGPTSTNFQQRANIERSGLVNMGFTMSAPAVARIGYVGLQRRQRVVVPGLINRVMAVLTPLLPRRIVLTALHRMHAPR
jgi:short-subunit dehydrogenase